MLVAQSYKDLIKPDVWRSEGSCTCGGVLTFKYTDVQGCGIKLLVKPNKGKFNLYTTATMCKGKPVPSIVEWDKPLSELETILNQHGL